MLFAYPVILLYYWGNSGEGRHNPPPPCPNHRPEDNLALTKKHPPPISSASIFKKECFLEEELLIVRNSGEIPEIAMHGALYYLSRDPEGPGLILEEADIARLAAQALARYREIILRDLEPANRDLSLYRGIKRCLANWERLSKFRARRGLPEDQALRKEIGEALRAFLAKESKEVLAGERISSINCPAPDLLAFCGQLGIAPGQLPEGWEKLCPEP